MNKTSFINIISNLNHLLNLKVIFYQAAVDYKPNEIDENVREQELKMKITENEVLHEQVG